MTPGPRVAGLFEAADECRWPHTYSSQIEVGTPHVARQVAAIEGVTSAEDVTAPAT